MEITIYRGETEGQNDEDGIWYSTDREHCSYFGEVEEYTLHVDESSVLRCDGDELYDYIKEVVGGVGGIYPEDEIWGIKKRIEECDRSIDVVLIDGWEGDGTCVVDFGGCVE